MDSILDPVPNALSDWGSQAVEYLLFGWSVYMNEDTSDEPEPRRSLQFPRSSPEAEDLNGTADSDLLLSFSKGDVSAADKHIDLPTALPDHISSESVPADESTDEVDNAGTAGATSSIAPHDAATVEALYQGMGRDEIKRLFILIHPSRQKEMDAGLNIGGRRELLKACLMALEDPVRRVSDFKGLERKKKSSK